MGALVWAGGVAGLERHRGPGTRVPAQDRKWSELRGWGRGAGLGASGLPERWEGGQALSLGCSWDGGGRFLGRTSGGMRGGSVWEMGV